LFCILSFIVTTYSPPYFSLLIFIFTPFTLPDVCLFSYLLPSDYYSVFYYSYLLKWISFLYLSHHLFSFSHIIHLICIFLSFGLFVS
jgi:hypothetical protein